MRKLGLSTGPWLGRVIFLAFMFWITWITLHDDLMRGLLQQALSFIGDVVIRVIGAVVLIVFLVWLFWPVTWKDED